MSAKDVIAKVLDKAKIYADQNTFVKEGDVLIGKEHKEKFVQQILDSLPKLDREKIREYIDRNKWVFENTKRDIEDTYTNGMKKEIRKHTDYEWEKLIDFICSLIPAGEVVATGTVDEITDEIVKYLDNFFTLDWERPRVVIRATIQGLIGLDKAGRGRFIWVPDKEDK